VLWLAPPLVVFARLSRPLTLLMSGTANLVLRLFGYQPAHGEESVHSVEELLLLIEDTEEAGVLDPDAADYVENVFRLSGKMVRDDAGKILGLLTLEDVLEEIIGDIEDEHDRPTPKVKVMPRLKRVMPKPKPPAPKS